VSQGVWRRLAWSVAALVLCVLNARCAEHHSSDLGDEEAARKKIPANVLRDLERGLTTDVVIALAEPEATSDAQLQNMELMPAEVAEPLREEIVQDRAELYRALQDRVIGRAPTRGLVLVKRYENLPILHFQASQVPALVSLLQQPEVDGVFEDFRYEHQLTRSLPLIQQPTVAANGLRGEGTSVAVFDTGCDFTRSDFGSCTSAGAPGCKVAFARDFGGDDGSRDDNGHGTNVSAIVLGVAPQTKILALDVFAGGSARWTDLLAAMDWVIANRTTYNIVGINMSLGGGQYSATCGGDAMSNAIKSARSLGVLTAIASGNNGWSQYMSAPGCAPDAISVGAVYAANFGGRGYSACSDLATAADKITCFSNSTSFLSMLAPGALISAGGYTMAGTSQATPHVAGAIAALRSAFPDESIASTAARLTESGPTITDPRNGVTKHRLDLLAALNGEGIADRTAPTGSISINGGDGFTRSNTVTLALTGTDNQSAVEICVSNTNSCSTFVPFVSGMSWTLQEGDGLKTVYLTLRDASNNQTKVSDTITLDATPPSGSNLSIVPADGAVYLNWTQASDAASGFERYILRVAQDNPSSCTDGAQLSAGGATSFVHTKLQNGATYAYRLCLLDKAGNMGEGPTGLGKPAVEHGTPFGAVIINGDAEFASSRNVVLTLTATDTSDAVQICVSNGDSCTDWVSFIPILPWRIDAASGTATVKVWFKDGHGVLSATPVSDSIRVDLDKPGSSILSAQAGNAEVRLTWTSATDATSGLVGYRIVAQLVAAPSCAEGVQIYRGTATSFTHSGLKNGADYGYRVCTYDMAGNEQDGSSALVRPVPERDAPVGTVEINAGAGYTRASEVTLTLMATDASGVAEMCISNTTSCNAWLGYAPMLPWTLDTSTTAGRVYVWFRDIYGTTSSAPISSSIVFDTTAPQDGQLTATAQDAAVSVSWSGVTDASGVTSFKLVGQAGEAPSCADGPELYSGTGSLFLHSGLTNGTVYGYRLCPTDRAGNQGSGPTASARPVPELEPPTGSLTINAGAAYATSVDVTVRVTASDASGVAQMCLSNEPTCQSWVTYTETSSWKLSSSGAMATVYAWLRDTYGSTTLVPVSDTIVVDKSPPSAGRLDAVPGNARVQLTWSDVTDDVSGVARYKLVGQAGAVPSCDNGPVLYTGANRTFAHEGLTNGSVYSYRLCPIDAAGNMASGASAVSRPAPERDAPVGTLVIAAGAMYANSADVTLTLSASDASGVAQVCLSNTAQCSAWLTYAPSMPWRLDTNASLATVNAWFRDTFGNASLTPVSDTIAVDLVAPESGTLSATASNTRVALTWTGASDAGSGVAGYKLVAAEGGAPTCAQGSEIYRGVGTAFMHTGLTNGVIYGYRLCAIDAAGNTGTGTTASARPAPERDGPIGSVVINGGAAYTRVQSVTLGLAATDASQVTDMCISNTSSCTAWSSFAVTSSWNLATGAEMAEVSVWYRDVYGNVSAAPARDTIVVDSTAPTSGMLSGQPSNAANMLSWTAASDAKSGVAGYKLVMALDAIPECDTGTSIYTGTARSYTHTALENGRAYGYRICANDAAGNVASGPTLMLRPAPEFVGPTGTVVINDNAQYTRDTAVTLTLSAQDPNGVAEVCISNSMSCQQWRAMQPTSAWMIAASGGSTLVYVWFKDTYGNVSATPVSDSIILDRTAPQAGALTANAGNASVSLTWEDASDMASGISRYDLYAAAPGAEPTCSGTPVYSGAGKSFTHTGLVNGSTYGYRLCPIDGAGNVGTGSTASARPRPETTGPTCTVSINAGASFTNNANVTLTLSATDPSGAPEMCISDSAMCTTWTSASAQASFTLRAQSGAVTVSVWFKDSYGNISAAPCTDSIIIDKTAPLSGELTAEAPALNVTLRWTASSDSGSGLASNKLVVRKGEMPSCTTGTEIYSGGGSTFTHTGLEDGATYFYRLCPVDGAGNVGEGATASLRVISEREGPIGQVSINAGAEFTRTAEVTLTIAASDPHGVVQMCVANAESCSAWQPFAATLPWTLDVAPENNRVRVWFKDDFGNVSAQPASDTIVLDSQSPNGGQLFAVPANASVTLTWTGSADSVSGVAGYRLRVSEGDAPSCESGTEIYYGPALNYPHTGLQNGTSYGYRVCPVDRAGNMGAGVSATAQPKPEFDGPQGSVTIAGGAVYTNTLEVTLTISAQDPSGVTAMCISNDSACSSWSALATSVTWALGVSSGPAVVYALFRDSFGNVSSSVVSDSIIVDREPPNTHSFSATPGNAAVSVLWSASDSVSGVSQYRLMAAAGTAPGCAAGTPVYQGTSTQFTHSGLQNGTLYAYRICAVDAAGNWATERTLTARPAPEFVAPTGSVAINAGAANTASTQVALTLTAQDASGVAEMCISNSSSCLSWLSFAPFAPWTLESSNGSSLVRVWFKDTYGNVSAQPVSDTIVLDTVAPGGGELNASPGDSQIQLLWTAASDATTGVVAYVLRSALDNTPACNTGDELYRGAAMSFVHTGLQNGALYAYRVCPIDAAGNVGAGITISTRPAPELEPPTGRVYINAGARIVGTQQVSLTMTATDANGVTHMCLSNTTTCNDWVAFASSSAWTLATSEGPAVVRAWFRDSYGNAMVVPTSATTVVDMQGPVMGALNTLPTPGKVYLSWSAASDVAGVASYTLMRAAGETAPSDCTTGEMVYSGTDRATNHNVAPGTYSYRLCATDLVGNRSEGTTRTVIVP